MSSSDDLIVQQNGFKIILRTQNDWWSKSPKVVLEPALNWCRRKIEINYELKFYTCLCQIKFGKGGTLTIHQLKLH